MRKVWSATILCSVTLRQTRNPGLSASKSGEEVKSKWIGLIGKNWSGMFESRGEKRFWIKEHLRREESGQYTALEVGIGLRLFLSFYKFKAQCNDCKEQNLLGIYTCPAEANPIGMGSADWKCKWRAQTNTIRWQIQIHSEWERLTRTGVHMERYWMGENGENWNKRTRKIAHFIQTSPEIGPSRCTRNTL